MALDFLQSLISSKGGVRLWWLSPQFVANGHGWGNFSSSNKVVSATKGTESEITSKITPRCDLTSYCSRRLLDLMMAAFLQAVAVQNPLWNKVCCQGVFFSWWSWQGGDGLLQVSAQDVTSTFCWSGMTRQIMMMTVPRLGLCVIYFCTTPGISFGWNT